MELLGKLVKKPTEALKHAAFANGKELKTLELGSFTPRFFAQLLVETPAEVKTFFLNRCMMTNTLLSMRHQLRIGRIP